jgi:ubiquinone/menaquinone biosynthesis C-methylase UbiE
MNEEKLVTYYNKFNEDKRLTHRHGIVEFNTTMHYLKTYLNKYKSPKILDVGAGTGAYTIPLSLMGYDVKALELVKHNLMYIKKKNSNIDVYQGNAINLSKFEDNTFDIVLLFGPMYHLISFDDKLKALNEAKRVLKKDGLIFISYYMNEYGIIKHGFMEDKIMEEIDRNVIDNNYKINSKEDDLYSFVRIEDIKKLSKLANLKRIKILAQDGPSDYIRSYINKMDDKTFETYMDYHMKTCERKELLGASSHILDILKKD